MCAKWINQIAYDEELVRGRLCQNGLISKKKVSFDLAIALCSIGAPDIPKNFAQRSEMENMVF